MAAMALSAVFICTFTFTQNQTIIYISTRTQTRLQGACSWRFDLWGAYAYACSHTHTHTNHDTYAYAYIYIYTHTYLPAREVPLAAHQDLTTEVCKRTFTFDHWGMQTHVHIFTHTQTIIHNVHTHTPVCKGVAPGCSPRFDHWGTYAYAHSHTHTQTIIIIYTHSLTHTHIPWPLKYVCICLFTRIHTHTCLQGGCSWLFTKIWPLRYAGRWHVKVPKGRRSDCKQPHTWIHVWIVYMYIKIWPPRYAGIWHVKVPKGRRSDCKQSCVWIHAWI